MYEKGKFILVTRGDFSYIWCKGNLVFIFTENSMF